MGISRDALQTVRDYLAKHHVWCVLVQGGVSEHARNQAVEAFQSNDRCQVFIGNMTSAGTGLSLPTPYLDVLESSWVPGTNYQAILRIRHFSQKHTQYARFITLARSLDEVVNRVVADKTRAIAMVEGDAMISAPAA
jgi:hypothetical protein